MNMSITVEMHKSGRVNILRNMVAIKFTGSYGPSPPPHYNHHYHHHHNHCNTNHPHPQMYFFIITTVTASLIAKL